MYHLENRVFGKLTVIGVSARKTGGRLYWDCLCSCGTHHTASTNKLISGKVTSCGCRVRGQARVTHGETRGHRSTWSPRSKMWYASKSRAKKSGLPFNLDLTDIVIPENCPVFGFPLICNRAGYARFNSPSLDRILPALGYVKGNIQVISHKANTMKNDATIDDVQQLLKFMQSK